jgi:chromate transporter
VTEASARPGVELRSRPHLREIFAVFFRAGLAFGGGVNVLGVLDEQMVERRKWIAKDDLLAMYAIGRIVPSGTMTALAIGYGHRFRGAIGGFVALAGLLLPAFVTTMALTIVLSKEKDPALLAFLGATLLPAAVALIAQASFKLGEDVLKPTRAGAVVFVAFVTAILLHPNPAFVLLGGGVAGALFFEKKEATP